MGILFFVFRILLIASNPNLQLRRGHDANEEDDEDGEEEQESDVSWERSMAGLSVLCASSNLLSRAARSNNSVCHLVSTPGTLQQEA